MEGGPVPICNFCNQLLTVEHIMIQCTQFNLVRRRFYNVQNMKELFDTISNRKIIAFIKEAGLYSLI